MASVEIIAGAGGAPIALDMNQIDISAWLTPTWVGVLNGGTEATWFDGSLSTLFYGQGMREGTDAPRSGSVWAIEHAVVGEYALFVQSFGPYASDDLVALMQADDRLGFWSAVLADADDITGTPLDDRVFGWGGSDAISLGAGNDTVRGGAGDDTVVGGEGADRVNGDGGNDRISGNAGRDRLTGGSGADSFVFTDPPTAANRDRITDFAPEDDLIILSRSTFSLNGSNGQAMQAANFHLGASATETGHRIMYDPATGNLLHDRDGSGPKSTVIIAFLDAGLVLSAADFVLTA